MAMMPGAVNRLLANQARQGLMKSYQGVCLHTMVGSLAGTDSMFQKDGTVGTESHFGVGEHGEIYQWVDTKYTADANYLGSGHVISIETADYGGSFGRWNTSGDNVPYWNAKQIASIVKIIVWACNTHDIPIRMMANSRDRGIGYHAMGVPGNELPNKYKGTKYQWSKYAGKVCPGKKRISQVPEIIKLAKGGKNTETEGDWFDMATEKDLRKIIREEIDKKLGSPARQDLANIIKDHAPKADFAAFQANPKDPKRINIAEIGRTAQRNEKILREVRGLVRGIATKTGMTANEIGDVVREALAESTVQVRVDVNGTPVED